MIRYAILYFVLLVVFIALIVGPVVAGKFLKLDFKVPMDLLQPTGLNNNNTKASGTGTCLDNQPCPVFKEPNEDEATGEDAAATGDVSEKLRRFMAY